MLSRSRNLTNGGSPRHVEKTRRKRDVICEPPLTSIVVVAFSRTCSCDLQFSPWIRPFLPALPRPTAPYRALPRPTAPYRALTRPVGCRDAPLLLPARLGAGCGLRAVRGGGGEGRGRFRKGCEDGVAPVWLQVSGRGVTGGGTSS